MLLGVLLAACSAPTQLDPTVLPPHAPGVVLLATASATTVTIGGTVTTEQYVDLDPVPDSRDGFRYQLLDAGGTVVYERTTNGPMVVQAFLGYWGEVAGVDLLDSIPVLGRFPLHVPLLPDVNTVRFQLRDGSGTYLDAGTYDLRNIEADDVGVYDKVTNTALLHDSGPSSNRLDIAILGDGYTEAEMGLFAQHADSVAERILSQPPYSDFSGYINIHRVDTPSEESGASFDSPTAAARETAFGSIFIVELINRLTGGDFNSVAVFQSLQWEVAQAASAVPWDTAIVLINSDRFGGMAVHVASATTGFDNFERTAVHEMGHSFGLLGDEYAVDDCIRNAQLGLAVNITDNPTSPPWDHWIEPGTELPTAEGSANQGVVGAFSPAYNCGDLYRPRQSCLMNSGNAFCPVCAEQLVRRIFRHADPVDELVRSGGRAQMDGPGSGVLLEWSREGEVFATSTPGEAVRTGSRPFDVTATVQTDWVRVGDDHVETFSYE